MCTVWAKILNKKFAYKKIFPKMYQRFDNAKRRPMFV